MPTLGGDTRGTTGPSGNGIQEKSSEKQTEQGPPRLLPELRSEDALSPSWTRTRIWRRTPLEQPEQNLSPFHL